MMTMTLVMATVLRIVVEFNGIEDPGTVVLAGPVKSGMLIEGTVPVPEKDDVRGGKSSRVLLGTGGE